MRLFAGRVQRGHHGAAHDAAARALADRPGQVSGRRHHPARRSPPARSSTWFRSTSSATPRPRRSSSGYIGFLLLGMACLAVGQLFSALTQNQIVAALITARSCSASGSSGTCRASRPPSPWRSLLLSVVRPALRRFHPGAGAQRSRGLLPGRLRHRADPERQLPPVAALTWTAPFRAGLILLAGIALLGDGAGRSTRSSWSRAWWTVVLAAAGLAARGVGRVCACARELGAMLRRRRGEIAALHPRAWSACWSPWRISRVRVPAPAST